MSMNKKSGLLPTMIGLLLIAAALILALYNIWDGSRAKKASDEIMEKLEDVMEEKELSIPGYDSENKGMPSEEIDGWLYIGILDIPSLGLHLPVMQDWDYEKLKASPCRYIGSYYSDDMVICAHNYAEHFGFIKWVDIGADVYFISVDGKIYHYQVSNRETVRPIDIKDMIDNTEVDWDMTLFTCNLDGQTRCAVRCVRVQ